MAATTGKRRSFNTDLDHLRGCFNNVDHQKSGFIGLQELAELVESMPGSQDSVVAELMEKLDRDKDGKVSFDDFVWLFELEQESTSKKQKLNPLVLTKAHQITDTVPTPSSYNESSPNPYDDSDSGDVVLRKTPRRMTMPARLQRHGRDFSMLSPIPHQAGKRPPSNDLTDLASQMKYLTDASESTDSPKLRRNSKVLSWIESEDMLFEDTGTGLGRRDELPSPPLSPTHGTDETSQLGSILESVCNTKEVSRAAIAKLCDHVKADPQEQQELVTLLHHLDKDNKGFVSTTEFAQGLQIIKNSVAVTPTNQVSHKTGFREVTLPRLSEPFGTPQGTKSPPLSSTPMLPSSTKFSSILTATDPSQSGYVKIDDVVKYWQEFGIETPHDQSLESILNESLPVDPSGHISTGDLTATLESSIITDGKSQHVLRQVALKSFKNEISTLRTQVHQVSMERDKLKSSLNRTVEEKSKLITEGDEHMDMISKKSEREKRQQEASYLERIKEVEKTKQEEALHLQERASNAIKDLEERMKELKREEEKLREDLKFANEDVIDMTHHLSLARKEVGKKDRTIAMLQSNLGSRSEHDIVDDESYMHRVNELENEVSEKIALISELQDKLRETQDTCDELKAENERMKQKNMAQKRSMQKSSSLPSTRNTSAKRRSKHLNRPLSGSHFHRRSIPGVPTSMDLDLAVHHPILQERQEGEEEEEEEEDFMLPPPDVEENLTETEVDPNRPESEDDSTGTEDDIFAQSSASLMEEFHQEKMATLERKRSIDLNNQLDVQRSKHEEIVSQLKKDIFRLEEFSDSQQEQALKMEEEKAMAVKGMKELKYEVESERQSHEVEVNILSRKLENAENDTIKLERQMAEERKLIRDGYDAKLLAAEKEAESKISALQDELVDVKVDQTSLQSQLSQTEEKLVNQKKEFIRKSSDALAKLEGKHMEKTRATKAKHKTEVEKLHEEIIGCERRERKLQFQLDSSSSKLETQVTQLRDLQLNEADYRRAISALETSEAQHLSELSNLQANVSKLQEDITHMKSAAVAYKNKISNLKEELQKEAEFEEYFSQQSSSRRSSTSSESSRHGDIISKMKVQLGELQKVLISKSAQDLQDEEERHGAELINALISNSSALDADVKKLRKGISAERQSHLQVCSQKDELLHSLKADRDRQSKCTMKLVTSVSEGIISQITSLQRHCGQSLERFTTNLDEVLLNLSSIDKSLKEKDLRHTGALHSLLSDLDLTHAEITRHKAEISYLQQELEKSHHNLDELNESQEQLQRSKDQEMHELRSKLEQAESVVSSDVVSSRHVKVDAGSGQVISEHHEDPTKNEQLEEVIHSLNSEIEQLRQAERHTKITTEDANRRRIEKEREMKQCEQELESLQRIARELELKLTKELDKYKADITTLKQSVQSAKEKLQASTNLLELKHKASIVEIENKHASEIQSVHAVVVQNTAEARELYNYLLDATSISRPVTQLNHSHTIAECKREIYKMREQYAQQQRMYGDLEADLAAKMEEHDILETQFTMEHEEEVRALRQQKRQIMKKLEELQEHCQNVLDSQEEQNAALLQELTNSSAEVQKQLKEKTEEAFYVYQQVADLSEEKKVLVDIIKQLCTESGRHINVV